MRAKPLILPAMLAGLVWVCDPGDNKGMQTGGASPIATPSAIPAAPSSGVLAALRAQSVGRRLLGNTVMLAGDQFVAADLVKAPDYYLVYYSASW